MSVLPVASKDMRAWRGAAARLLRVATLLAMTFAGPAQADDQMKGDVSVYTDGGYGRLLFRFDDQVEASVHQSGAVLIVNFKKPVNVSVDRLNISAPDYISAARRDPDGTAVRIALARKVTVHTIPAGERYYIDLLPDTWTGVKPGLPQEVIDDLARRAREAERKLHQQRLTEREKQAPLIRVRVARQPTFMRYVFDMPVTANVVPAQSKGQVKLNFDQQIRWDLADAIANLPPTLKSIDTDGDFDSTSVTFVLNGSPEVRTFREDRGFAVDVSTGGAPPKVAEGVVKKAAEATPPGAAPAIDAPDTVPAKDTTPPEAAQAVGPQPKVIAVPAAPAPSAPLALPPAPIVAQPPKQVAAAAAPAAAPAPETAKAAAPVAPPPAVAMPSAPAAPPPVAAAASTVQPAPAAPQAPTAPAAAPVPAQAMAARAPAPDPNAPVVATVRQSSDALKIEFPFAVPTPSAVFRRADMVWMVFDSAAVINVGALAADTTRGIAKAVFERAPDGAALVRLTLNRPRLVSLQNDGPSWIVTIADTVTAPTQPLTITRTLVGKNRASISVAIDHPAALHILRDPEIGDRLMVVTTLAPVRGLLKPQYFVELRALATTQGIAVQPIADDVTAQVESDRVTIGRPGGLSISSTANDQAPDDNTFVSLAFDTQVWDFDRHAPFVARQAELIGRAAAAPEARKRQARLNLARFYLARDMGAEAKGVLDVAAEQRGDDLTGSILKAVADVMLDRPEDALKELAAPEMNKQQDAPVWRAIAYERQGKWVDARENFKAAGDAMTALPVELQRMAMLGQLRCAIEVGDFAGASRLADDFEALGVPHDMEAAFKVLTGRLKEGLGRNDDALADYRAAAAADDRSAAAQGRLREIELMSAHNAMPRNGVIVALETLTTTWRGDDTETEGLKLLAHLYTEDGRYRDAFHVMRTALLAHPNSDLTRKIQDEAAATFDSLFLEGEGDSLPPIEALGLFYDYRELTPIGRRGDEMIRHLADRLVSVDLLDQAAELLQHQVDHRLQGAARAQVATKLAIVYLMNHKPDRALQTLQATRTSELANELRDQRLLLQARALSDIGRPEVALQLIANIDSRESTRLRADILWAAKRWREASEQIEKLYGERWRDFTPLNDGERIDILRAAVGYTLADESFGLMRLREKYGAKMADGPDARAFTVAVAPDGTSNPDFMEVGRRVASVDTLGAFLRGMRARYPDAALMPGSPPKKLEPSGPPQASVPMTAPATQAGQNMSAKADAATSPLPPAPPAGVPLRPDLAPTGSISRMPKARPKQAS
ncbi:MAG TPA: tetratricopeptide repeat protein [Pseudolabrys sp.]